MVSQQTINRRNKQIAIIDGIDSFADMLTWDKKDLPDLRNIKRIVKTIKEFRPCKIKYD